MRRAAVAAVLLIAGPAFAALGGTRGSVDIDRVHFAATMASAATLTHMVHTLTLANGSTVREFAAADGTVFAVAWAGPGRPDLRQLLGATFDAFQTDVTAARGRPRRAMAISRDDLVVASFGHPGAFRGFAYLPKRLPAGFAADALD